MGQRQYIPRIVAVDAGGTHTDSILVDNEGNFSAGKSLTNHADESLSYLESINDAADKWGVDSKIVHQNIDILTYTGTGVINILLTRTGQKVGLLLSRGFESIPRFDRVLTWLGQPVKDICHPVLHTHPPLLVDMHNVKPITERIAGGSYYMNSPYPPGKVMVPLAEQEVKEAAGELIDARVDVVGICFFNSYANPAHEHRAAEICRQVIEERGSSIPVICSFDICPTMRMDGRFQDLLLECYASLPLRRSLSRVEEVARQEGYKHDLVTLLGYGGSANLHYPRMYEAIVSGPVGGIIAGKLIADTVGIESVMCSDMGGTTWDMGIINKGIIELRKEADFVGRRFSLPMVSVESFGAGTGAYIHVDRQFKRMELGPESAGANVGVCFRSPEVTVSDADLVLGYLDPDYFLGGKIRLDKERAKEALSERVAEPLGLDLYDAAAGVIDFLHSSMRDMVSVNLSNRGFNFADYVLLVYGGGGPLHAWGFTEGIPFKGVLSFPWAAVFAAYGAAFSDYMYRRQKAVNVLLPAGTPAELKMAAGSSLNSAWQECERTIFDDFEQAGFTPDKVSLRHGIYARYLGQLESWEAKVDVNRVNSPGDMDKVLEAFESAYVAMLPRAATFSEAGYHITELYVEGTVPKVKPVITKYALKGKTPRKSAYKGRRQVYHQRKWTPFDILEMDELEAGNRVEGPAIIEHPMTTYVVPPEKCVELDEHKFIWYRPI